LEKDIVILRRRKKGKTGARLTSLAFWEDRYEIGSIRKKGSGRNPRE